MRLRLVVVAAVALVGAPAYAQDFHATPYSESVYNEGPGFRISNGLVIHPGIAADFGYDSNVFYTPTSQEGSALMRLRAHLDLATLPPQSFENDESKDVRKVEFRFSAQVDYREYLNTNPIIQAQRSVNLFGGFHLSILPAGPFTLTIDDSYVRTVDPRNFEPTMLMGATNFTRDYNRASLTGVYKIGQALELGIGDYFQVNYYESGPRFGDSLADEGQLWAKWRILPRSILSLQLRVGYTDYVNNETVNAIPLRAVAGFSTLVSTWFGLSVTAGYGNSLNRTGPSYNNFVGGAELRFMLPYKEIISLIYDRDFYDSLFANFFVDDHVGLVFEQPFTARLAARLEGGVRFRHYEGLVPPMLVGYDMYSSPNTRDDIVYLLRAELTVRATDWLAFTASYNLLADQTDFAFIDTTGARTQVNYIKHSAFGRIDVAY